MNATDRLHDIPEKGDEDSEDPYFWLPELRRHRNSPTSAVFKSQVETALSRR